MLLGYRHEVFKIPELHAVMPQIDGRYPFNSFDSMTADRALLMRQCTARQTERGRLHGPLTRIPHSYRYQVIETGLANAMFLSAVHDRLLPPPTTTASWAINLRGGE